MKRIHTLGIMMSVLVAFLVMCLNSPSHGQHSGKRNAASPPKSESETNSDTQALIGQFGYKIQVPEMTMNQISASGKSKPPVSVPQQSTPIISAPVPDRIVTEEVSAQPVKTPKPPEVQKPVESVNVMKVEKEPGLPSWPFGYIGFYNFIKLPDKLEFSGTSLMALIFVLIAAAGFSPMDGYVVIKDKKGLCRVIKSGKKTSSTIAGPFMTKEMAKKALEKTEASPALMNLPERNVIQQRLPIRCCKMVASSQPTMPKVTLTGDAGLFGKSTSKRETASQ